MPGPLDDIFGQWTWPQMEQYIDTVAAQERVPRDLVRAVVKQESNWDPYAVGDGGQAKGFFQLHPGAAKDAGIDPARRDDIGLNIQGGIRYLRLKLDQAGGDVDKALRLYNGGGDPNYVANVRRHLSGGTRREQPSMLSRASSILSPASAEAATPQQAAPTAVWEDIFGPQQAPSLPEAPAPRPSPPTARSTPEQDAAYRASRMPQEPGTSPPPTPAPVASPAASQAPGTGDLLARFDALPSVRSWTPAERAARRREFAALRPDLQEEFLRGEEPPSDLVVDIEKPSTPQAGAAGAITPDELDAALTRELAPAQQGMTGLLLGGAAGTAGRAVGQLAQRALPWLGRAAGILPVVGEAGGSYAGRQANVALGYEEPGTVGDIIAGAGPLVTRAVGAIAPAIVRRLPGAAGAQHEMLAERIQAVPAQMQPPTPSQTLYRAVVQQGNPTIPVQDLRRTAQELIATNTQRGAATRNTRVLRLAQEIDALAAQYGDNVPMDRLYDTMQGAGEILGQVQRTGGRGARDISRLYDGFHGALENAAQSNIPGAETLQNAIRASRQEHAAQRLQRIVGQGRGIEEQQGSGFTFVRGKKMLNEFDRLVEDDAVFRGSFTPAELAETRALFQEATRLPNLPAAGGAQYGSGRAATRAAVGSMLGGPAGAAIAVSGPEVIARAMMTRPGRAMLRAALEGRGGLTPQALATLDTALREMLPQGTP